MSNETIKIGIPSKGRLKSGVLDIFKMKKLKIFSERVKENLLVKLKEDLTFQFYFYMQEKF